MEWREAVVCFVAAQMKLPRPQAHLIFVFTPVSTHFSTILVIPQRSDAWSAFYTPPPCTLAHWWAWRIYRTSTVLWGYCFRAAHPRKPSWRHQCLCSVRRDFTVRHISQHLSGILISETAPGYRWVITNGIELNKTRSTGVIQHVLLLCFCIKKCGEFCILAYGNVRSTEKGWWCNKTHWKSIKLNISQLNSRIWRS